jgi:hypothetical protein
MESLHRARDLRDLRDPHENLQILPLKLPRANFE